MIDLQMKFNPCPKCGGHPVVYQTSRWFDGQEDFTIRCLDCGLELDYSNHPNDLPHTSIRWSYDEFAALSPDVVWNGVKLNA